MGKSRWESDEEDDRPLKKERPEKRHKKKDKKQSTPSHRGSIPPFLQRALASKREQIPVQTLTPCRHIDCYEKLNDIEEGSYGIVYRARNIETGEIVAVKRIKMQNMDKIGFPVTSLRERHTLMLAKHPHIVNVLEIAMGDLLDQVFIIMEFVEHDLKTLITGVPQPFLPSEIKTLMFQLLSAVAHMHDIWIIHRDLKMSNLLLSNRGELKVADFGLARKYGSPLGNMTKEVVTLWYRAPELLLGAREYSTAIDMWSIGCIFGELIDSRPLIAGEGEIDQINKMFRLLGMPNDTIWPGFSDLPHARLVAPVEQQYETLRKRYQLLTEAGFDLMKRLLTYDPKQRISAEEALKHPYFFESPPPQDPSLFPTWPSKGSGEKKRMSSPSAPHTDYADALD